MAPQLESVNPVLMARDVAAAIRFYEQLGFTVAFQNPPPGPAYAGMRRDSVEIHLQWQDASHWDHPGDRPAYRFGVRDVDGLFAEFHQRGAVPAGAAVADTPWGTREFHLRDPDANVLQFYRLP